MTASPRPEARRPRWRERSEAAKNSVALAFNAAWANPTRRGRASVWLQSVNPVIAEPSAPARPRARLASAARVIPERPRRSPRASSQSWPSSQAVILSTTVGRRRSLRERRLRESRPGLGSPGPFGISRNIASHPLSTGCLDLAMHEARPPARDGDQSFRVRPERPLVEVTPESLDRQAAEVEKRADLPGIPGACHESRLYPSLCPLRGAIAVAIPGLPEIAAGPSPRLGDAQNAAGVPDPALGDLDPPAAPVKTFQHEASLGGKLIRDLPECPPPIPDRRPVGERIARRDDQIEGASEDEIAHVRRDEAGSGPFGAPPPSAREHFDGDVDSNRRSVTRERAGDPSQPAADLQNPAGSPAPGETSPESQMRVRRGLLLIDGKDLAVVSPEVFDRHGSRCIPLPWRACSSSPARRRTCAAAAAHSSESRDSGARSNPAATRSSSSPLPRAAPFP